MADFEINKRLRNIIEEVYRISPVEFAKKYNDTKAVKTYNIISERNGVSNKMLETILTAYPEINKIWLLTGEGERMNNTCPDVIRTIEVKKDEVIPPIVNIPYEFVLAIIDERKRHDEKEIELIRQNGVLVDALKKHVAVSSVQNQDATCANVSGSDLSK